MNDTQARGTTPEFRQLALSQLHESPSNPRRHWPKAAMDELTQSIRQIGILTPILVRTNATGYEIAAGHRRYRAAKAAGLSEVPVIIREMTDQEFLEILTVENLHREDIHPLDEAASYRALMTTLGYDVPTLAAKVEKSERYIYQRLKLLDLTKPAQKAFLGDELTVGHAILIARLQPGDQARVMQDCVQPVDGGFRRTGPKAMLSVKHLESFIRTEIMLDLHKAPFKKDDAGLRPKAGACTDCAKRTGFNQSLFHDIDKADLCTDGACFNAKTDAFLARKKAELQEAGETIVELVDSACPYEEREKAVKQGAKTEWEVEKVGRKSKVPEEKRRMALIVAGPNRGKTFSVVLPEKGPRADGRSPQEIGRERAARRQEQLKQAVRDACYVAVATGLEDFKFYPDHPEALTLLAKHVWGRTWHEAQRKYCQVMHIDVKETVRFGSKAKDYAGTVEKLIDKMSLQQAMAFVLQLAVLGDVMSHASQPKDLHAVAQWVKVDPAAIEKAVKASMAPKKKPKASTKGNAKDKSGRTKKVRGTA